MRFGLSGAPVFAAYPGAEFFNEAGSALNFPPAALAAIAWNETLSSYPFLIACGVQSADGGCGLMQLTNPVSLIPPNWSDPLINIKAAITGWLVQIATDWEAQGFTGETLLKLTADAWNEGFSASEYWHNHGGADIGTTGGNYGSRAVANYLNIIVGKMPS